ncbi:MAG: polyhydroxyalkanoate synthesis regulator DNA-binding domain-containing protein, partial [Hyphomicrobiales bacterium]|nr:polyhydroxyalkanoate synthesis regulator DNA-binding domain-containing protein [Hyphomicrobiales bacterium]
MTKNDPGAQDKAKPDEKAQAAKGPVAIKKYANRRLYHTGSSEYVTLEDLARMVKAGEDFVVSDAKTGEDLTRSVLAQIIFEQ